MKRTPMQRRTPLNPRPQGGALARVALSRRTQLRPRSAKTRTRAPARAGLVQALLADRPWCEANLPGCARRSVDVHERCRRSQGGSILDPANCLTVCRGCHEWIGSHPTEAVRLGLAEWGWQHHQRGGGR